MSLKQKKILYIITKSVWGGAQRYVHDLSTNLPQEEFDVVVALGGAGELKKKLEEKNIRTISLSYLERDVHIFKEIFAFFELLSLFKRETPDTVHLNSSKAGALGAFAARFAGVPRIVFTAHGWAFNEERSILWRFLVRLISWITVMLAHKTITVSRHDRQTTAWMPFVDKKIAVIYNGMAPISFLDKAKARQKLSELISKKSSTNYKLQSTNYTVGTISELHKNKGLVYAINALEIVVKKHPKTAFVIIGEGEEREKLETLIEKRHLGGYVFLLGHIPNAAQYLKAFNIFMLTSIKEGLPYVLLEAGLAEKPVVTTNVGGIGEIVKNEETGLMIAPKNIDEIADAINLLIADSDKRLRFGKALNKHVKENFSLNEMAKKTSGIYKNNN